jgi:hypothetical protein
MHTGQIIFTIGALGLLSFAILNLNSSINENDISLAQNRYRLEALSLMTSYIEQANMYFFDEASTDTSSAKELKDFTVPNKLGFEADDIGEFDDFDDFNNYSKIDTGLSGVNYRVMFTVDYVILQADTFAHSNAKEYNKRMTISITDAYNDPLLYRNFGGDKVRDTLKVSFVNSYWFYN